VATWMDAGTSGDVEIMLDGNLVTEVAAIGARD
jgi:hypothetical protein